MTPVYVPKKSCGHEAALPCTRRWSNSVLVNELTMQSDRLCDREGTSQLPLLCKCSLYKAGCTQDALLLLGGEGSML